MVRQKILLLSGKGGVGKSSVAAAAAFQLAKRGQKVLLAELQERSFFQYLLGTEVDYEPRLIQPHLWVCRWDGESCLKEYISHLIKVERLVHLFFENRVLKSLIRAAPALKELAVLGKITSGIRGVGPALEYDWLVVDAFSTGHFQALLQAPRGMQAAIPTGPMGEQSRAIEKVLHDPTFTQVWLVSLPEELPVSETLEHAHFLKESMKIKPKIILNKCLQTELSVEDCKELLLPNDEKESGDFVSYLLKELEDQNKANIALQNEPLHQMPFVFKGAGAELISSLSNEVPAEWLKF